MDILKDIMLGFCCSVRRGAFLHCNSCATAHNTRIINRRISGGDFCGQLSNSCSGFTGLTDKVLK